MEYRISRVESVSEAAYGKIKDKAVRKGSDTVAIETLYEKSGDEWYLKEGAEEAVKKEIAEALKKARIEGKVIIDELPEGEKRIREVGLFTAEERKEIGEEYFEGIGDE